MKRIFTIIAFFAIIGIANAQTSGENFDVAHYEIHLGDFDFTNRTIQGEAFVDVAVTTSTNTFVLELKRLSVSNVTCNNYNINNYRQEDDFLIIVLDEFALAGEHLTFDIRYGGDTFSETWGGVEWWGNYVYNLGVGFDSQPHNLGKTWFPCVDNFTDKATYTLYITVTSDKKAICGGNLFGITDNGDGTSTWQWETPQEIATYHISFAIGDYQLWEDVYHGMERDIPIQVYAKPEQMANVPGTFVHVKEIASFYESCLGPYPFNRIGYVSTGKGCMEHTDNIAMATSIINGNTSEEEYVAHELSHMYFGNKVTCSTAGDMWLNEGFAQFWGVFYLSGVYGENEYQTEMGKKINTITNWCKNQNNWIPLNNMPLDMTYDGTAIYDRGAVIVNTMMHYLGRDTFLSALQFYLNSYLYGNASSEQLCDAITEATGVDMRGFFDTYVFTGGMPHYDVNLINVTPSGSQYNAEIQLGYWHVGPSHVGENNRVEVTFVGNEGQLHTELVGWDGLEGSETVTLDFEPIAAFADYYNHFLDAKLDKNLTATEAANLNISNYFQTTVNSVTGSSLLRLEEHFVGPDNAPSNPSITLSTRRYWNFFRKDLGDADVVARISFSNSSNQDNDIIQTDNDSAVLLYRANVMEPWQSIPYTQEGNWKKGRFTVNNPQSGQYTIAAIDKSTYGLQEHQMKQELFPNPASHEVNLSWEAPTSGMVRVFNHEMKLVRTIPFSLANKLSFSIEDLAPGLYFVECNNIIKKLIIQ